MRALKIFKNASKINGFSEQLLAISKDKLDETIKELEDLIQENKSLTKTLEKYNEEMINLRIEKKELIQVLIDAQETINKILEN